MYNFGLSMTQLSNSTFHGVNEKPKVSPWKLKNPNINIQDLNPTLYNYLESLPAELQSGIVITAGKEDGHSVTGGHGKGNAVDIRLNKSEGWDQKFMDYLYNDSEKRKNLGIAFLDPNHGTAPHIHLSIGVQHEIENDFYYGKKAVKPFQFKSGETKPEEVEALPAYTPIEMPKEYSNEALISSFNKAMEMANNVLEKEKENEAANYLIQRELERKQKLELVNSLSLSYETFMEDGGTIEFANGGPIKPSSSDSAILFRNAVKVRDFYDNSKKFSEYKKYSETKFDDYMSALYINDYKQFFENLKEGKNNPRNDKHKLVNTNFGTNLDKKFFDEKFKDVGGFLTIPNIYDGEYDSYVNPEVPPLLLHPTIKPKSVVRYRSKDVERKIGDVADVPFYDTMEIKPWHLLTAKEKKERIAESNKDKAEGTEIKVETPIFTTTPSPINPNYTAPDPAKGFPFIDATPVPANTPAPTTTPAGPTIWYTLAGDNKIHVGGVNKYMTFEEFDKYMDENPNNQYSAKANSVGYVYQRGKGAVKLN